MISKPMFLVYFRWTWSNSKIFWESCTLGMMNVRSTGSIIDYF